MKDETMAGYYQLLIAIFCNIFSFFCNLNAREARYLYDYGPAHPICRRMMYRKLKHQKQGDCFSEKEILDRLEQLEKNGCFYREEKGT